MRAQGHTSSRGKGRGRGQHAGVCSSKVTAARDLGPRRQASQRQQRSYRSTSPRPIHYVVKSASKIPRMYARPSGKKDHGQLRMLSMSSCSENGSTTSKALNDQFCKPKTPTSSIINCKPVPKLIASGQTRYYTMPVNAPLRKKSRTPKTTTCTSISEQKLKLTCYSRDNLNRAMVNDCQDNSHKTEPPVRVPAVNDCVNTHYSNPSRSIRNLSNMQIVPRIIPAENSYCPGKMYPPRQENRCNAHIDNCTPPMIVVPDPCSKAIGKVDVDAIQRTPRSSQCTPERCIPDRCLPDRCLPERCVQERPLKRIQNIECTEENETNQRQITKSGKVVWKPPDFREETTSKRERRKGHEGPSSKVLEIPDVGRSTGLYKSNSGGKALKEHKETSKPGSSKTKKAKSRDKIKKAGSGVKPSTSKSKTPERPRSNANLKKTDSRPSTSKAKSPGEISREKSKSSVGRTESQLAPSKSKSSMKKPAWDKSIQAPGSSKTSLAPSKSSTRRGTKLPPKPGSGWNPMNWTTQQKVLYGLAGVTAIVGLGALGLYFSGEALEQDWD